MELTVAERLQQANAAVSGSAAGDAANRTNQVDGALGRGAPAIISSAAKHMELVPGLFGKKHISEVIGIGVETNDGRDSNGSVHKSLNCGDMNSNRHVAPELKHMILDLKKSIHNAQLMQQIASFKSRQPVNVCDTTYFKAEVEPKLKAFSLADFSFWIPTANARFYFSEYEIEPGLAKYFEEYPMDSKSVDVPGATNRLKAYLESDTATFTAQYNTQARHQMSAQGCVASTDITEDLLQDLVPNAGAFERLRKEVLFGVQRSEEDALINGDDTGTVQGDGHMDSDVAGGSALLFNKAFKGLRKRAITASATYGNAGNGVDLSTFTGLMAAMGKFANDKGDLLWILGPTIDTKIVTGGVAEILTLQNVGGIATLLTGKVPRIFGVESFTSEWVREDVTTTGVYAALSALTTILLVKKSRFVIGVRAPVRIWATPSLASSDKMLLTAKKRVTFSGVTQSATEKSVVCAINVALT